MMFGKFLRRPKALLLKVACLLTLAAAFFPDYQAKAQSENVISFQQLAAGCRGRGKLAQLGNGNWYCCLYPIKAGTDCAAAIGIVGSPNLPKREERTAKSPAQRDAKREKGTPSPNISGRGRTVVCIRPIFEQEMKLRASIDGSSEKTHDVANAIIYLRNEFCRSTSLHLVADERQHIGDNCVQYTGLLGGERVYWGQCDE